MRRFLGVDRKKGESGAIISGELIVILTVLAIGLLVGWVAVRDSVVAEMHDIAEAVGELDQSYSFPGTNDPGTGARTDGAAFNDAIDSVGNSPSNTNAGDRTAINVQIAPSDESTFP